MLIGRSESMRTEGLFTGFALVTWNWLGVPLRFKVTTFDEKSLSGSFGINTFFIGTSIVLHNPIINIPCVNQGQASKGSVEIELFSMNYEGEHSIGCQVLIVGLYAALKIQKLMISRISPLC